MELDKMITNLIKPIVIDNFLTIDEIDKLKEIEKQNDFHQFYDSYFVTSAKPFISGKYEIINNIVERIGSLLDYEYEIGVIYLAKILSPLRVHVDTDWKTPEKSYTRVTCCFRYNLENESAGLVLFNQRHYGTPIVFAKGEEVDLSSVGEAGDNYINTDDDSDFLCVNSYDFLENYNNDNPFDKELYEKHLNYLRYENLDGLTVDRIIEQKIGQLVIFDMHQLHASQAMHKNQEKSELTISFLQK